MGKKKDLLFKTAFGDFFHRAFSRKQYDLLILDLPFRGAYIAKFKTTPPPGLHTRLLSSLLWGRKSKIIKTKKKSSKNYS